MKAIFRGHQAPSHPLSIRVNKLNIINFKARNATYDGKVHLNGANIEWRNSVFQNNSSKAGVVRFSTSPSGLASRLRLEDVHFLGNKSHDNNPHLVFADKRTKKYAAPVVNVEVVNSYYSSC